MFVLITGANGFIGTSLSKWLYQKGMEVYALDVEKRVSKSVSRSYTWDELGALPFGRLNAVVHLAGKAHDLREVSLQDEYITVNYGLTKLIVDHLNKVFASSPETAPVFVLMSSVKACADSVSGIMTETDNPEPLTPYGKSKLMAEEYVRENYQFSYILRSCMVHGPGNKGNFNLLFEYSKRGLPWPLGAFDNKRSFVSLSNLCFVIERIAVTRPEPGLYLVSDDEALSTNELLGLLWESRRKAPSILMIPKEMIRALAALGGILRLPLNTDRLAKLTDSYVVSNSKLKRALGIDKMPINAEDGFRETIRSLAFVAGRVNKPRNKNKRRMNG